MTVELFSEDILLYKQHIDYSKIYKKFHFYSKMEVHSNVKHYYEPYLITHMHTTMPMAISIWLLKAGILGSNLCSPTTKGTSTSCSAA